MLLVVWLLIPMIVTAQRDVVITVGLAGSSSSLYHIGFSSLLFTKFHECLSKGTVNCVAVYWEQLCHNCNVANVIQLGLGDQELQDYYYMCTNDAGRGALYCRITSPGTRTESYLLRNSSYPSTCFGFVWTFDTEGISFNSNQFDVEFCGANCACLSQSITSQSPTATFSLSTLPAPLSSTPVTPFPTRSSTKTPSETPTILTTAVPTADTSIHSTESSSGTDNSSDDTPVGAIVGAVLGVIIIILIIVVIVLMYRRRQENPKSPGNSSPGEQEVSDVPSSHTQTDNALSDDAGRIEKKNEGKPPTYMNTVLSGNTYEIPHDGANNAIEYQNVL